MSIPMDAGSEGSNNNNLFDLSQTYIAAADGVHGQQVVPVAQLELDHLLRCSEVSELLLLRLTALLDQILQEESVFTHPLDGLQQVRRQVHLISSSTCLFWRAQEPLRNVQSARVKNATEEKHQRLPWKKLSVAREQIVWARLVFAVQGVHPELLLLSVEKTLLYLTLVRF